MKKNDARKLDRRTQESLRIRAVASVQEGQSPELVARVLGIHRDTIYDWLAKYRHGGWKALKRRPAPGRAPKLDAPAMRWIYRTVVEKTPQQFQFEFALWNNYGVVIGKLPYAFVNEGSVIGC